MSAIVYFGAAILVLLAAQKITRFSRAAAIVILLLPLLFTGRALLTGGVFGPVDLAYTYEPLASIAARAGAGPVVNPSISDTYAEFIPWNDALRRSIAAHQWPLWDPYALCGLPLAGAAQSSPYHPITIVGLLVPLRQYFAFAAAMMLMTAALSAFLLFREFVDAEMAALFGAAGWMCSTHFVFFAGTALALAASIAPFVLLAARRVAREATRGSVVILTIALLLVVLAGHPESALHIVVLSVAYFLFALKDRRGRLSSTLIAGLSAGVVALLLSAIFVLPIIDTIQQTEEYGHRATAYRQRSSTVAQIMHRVVANLFPFAEGAPGLEEPRHRHSVKHGWFPTAYAGSMLFAPAAFAVSRSRSRERWFFLVALVVGFGAAFAVPGFAQVVAALPGFNISVQYPMIVFAILGICALAAIGIDHLEPRLAVTFAIVAVAVLIAAFAATINMPVDYVRTNAARALLPLALAACAIAVLPRRHAALFLLTLLLLQRAGEASALQPTLPARAFYPPFPGLEIMRANEPFRIVAVGAMLPPELSTHYALEDVRGFAATTFARLHQTYRYWSVFQPVWSNRVDDLESPMLSLMNARFAIVPSNISPQPGWVIRAMFPSYAIAENTRVLPRAFVPRNVKLTSRSLADIGAITDFGDKSVIEGANSAYQSNGPGTIAIGRYAQGKLRLHAHMENGGWVVVSNAFWRGWHAYEGNRELPLRFANHAFIGFYLPAGEHDVRMIYRPQSFVIGAWISGVTALLAIAYALIPSSAITFFMSFQTSFFALGVRRRYAG